MKMNKLLAKASVAEQLASDRVGKLRSEWRNELFGQLGCSTASSLKYSQDIIKLLVTEMQPVDVLALLVPWRTADMGAADVFDLSKPRVSLLPGGPQMKAQTFETMLCEHIVVQLILACKKDMEKLGTFVDACAEVVEEASSMTDMPVEFQKSKDHLNVMCAVLRLSTDPSPISVAKWTVHRRAPSLGVDL